VEQRRGVKKISIVAHSLGGLVARYAIGRLYERNIRITSVGNSRDEGERLEGLIAGLEAMNFITFASPHLGSSGNKQVTLISFFFINSSLIVQLSLSLFTHLSYTEERFNWYTPFITIII
jgi:triacylglycerol esterase/lipase EstA (alpha/beta hydrolase family)